MNMWKNEFTVREVIEQAIFDYELILKDNNKIKEMEIIRDINISFIQILYNQSEILIGHSRE
jgi:ABC-type uncharacterized transport system ATPase subunit